MIGAYLDESFDMKKKGIFAVGGLMGRGIPIFELEGRWRQLRQRPDIELRYYKASECTFGKGEFAKFVADPNNITAAERERLEFISHEFLSAITRMRYDASSYLIAFGVGVIQDDFYDVIRDDHARLNSW